MRHIALFLAVLGGLFVVTPSAHALDLEGVLLVGTGVNTGDSKNNPYALQIGGAGELTVAGWVVGVRGTRSFGTNEECVDCINVKDLRTIGGDFGWDWEVLLLHISPRLGFGYIKERTGDERVTGYLEPGAVVEAEVALFVAGLDVRYRYAVKEDELSGVIGYVRAGLRF
jgi:hypothetical protein